MLKNLWNLIVLTLAINFLLVAGVVGWLFSGGKLTKDKVVSIREILFATTAPTSQPTTEPSEQELPTTQPIVRLDDLLAKTTGRTASEQVDNIQTAIDTQSALLDRRAREIEDQRRQLDLARAEFEKSKKNLSKEQATLTAEQQKQKLLDENQGFLATLALYKSMPPKQVKAIFLSLDDSIVVQYLQSMEPRQASGILKEFKTPVETSRAQAILEKMRQSPTAKAE